MTCNPLPPPIHDTEKVRQRRNYVNGVSRFRRTTSNCCCHVRCLDRATKLGPFEYVLPFHEVGDARLTAAICFDLDFPGLVRQAARAGADVLLAPSTDWSGFAVLLTRMERLRAIESGVANVRPTSGGITVVYDAYGRTVSSVDTRGPGEHVVPVEVPIGGVGTIYGEFGDTSGAVYLLIFVVVGIAARRGKNTSPGY